MPDENFESSSGMSSDSRIGVLWGWVAALEKRADRNETWVGERFRMVEEKFVTMEAKVDKLDEKLDRVLTELAKQSGAKAMLNILMRPAFWLVSTAISLGIWFVGHFYLKYHL